MAKKSKTISVKLPKIGVIDHASRSHAILSASSAKRWMSCTPSAVLADLYGEDRSSTFADEGTLAHEMGELYLRRNVLKTISDAEFEAQLSAITSNPLFNDEMKDSVPIYTDYCTEEYNAAIAKNGSAFFEVEQKLDLTEWIPEGFGTSDCAIISDGTMEVIDLKYGKGVAVYADYNPQLMIYGLGAWALYNLAYDVRNVKLTIVQPRLKNISSWEISIQDLLKWSEEELKPKATIAIKGEGELHSGDWCRFCPVKARCKKLSEENLALIKHEFCDPRLLSDEEILDVMSKAPRVSEWAKSVAEYAHHQAVDNGKEWPGYKVVEGRSMRKWAISDSYELFKAIEKRLPDINPEEYMEQKVCGIGKLEKHLGKEVFANLKDLIVKPAGIPTLVPVEDPRAPMNTVSVEQEFMADAN